MSTFLRINCEENIGQDIAKNNVPSNLLMSTISIINAVVYQAFIKILIEKPERKKKMIAD